MIKPTVTLVDTRTVLEGSSLLTITCSAEGIPIPSVTWESLDVSIKHCRFCSVKIKK